MAEAREEPNLAIVRELLLAAFTAEALPRFCLDSPALRPILVRFSPGHGLDDMVDEVISYCRTHLLWDELLSEVRRVNPRQYARFEPDLAVPPPASSRLSSLGKPKPVLAVSIPWYWIVGGLLAVVMILTGGILWPTIAPDGPTPTSTPTRMPSATPTDMTFTASGMLNYRKQTQIPDNARVVVVWSVEAGPDAYLFGEGTIDLENHSFRIKFDDPPPPEALNWIGSSALGIGNLIITADQTLHSGILSSKFFSEPDILGMSGQYGIIYVSGSFETLDLEEWDWFNGFNQGYSAGKGIDIPDSVFDGFEPVDPTTIEIIIDDLKNIECVNWV